jgi:PAS domain S-box-containing protein
MPTKLTLKMHWLARYAAALGAVGAGLLLRLGLTALVGEGLATYITFYPAVMVVALLAGFGPGLLATLTTALVVDYTLLPPTGQFGVANAVDVVGLALFSGMGVFMSVVAELYRRARQRAAAHDTRLFGRQDQELPRPPLRETALLVGGLVLALAILGTMGWRSYRNLAATVQADRLVSRTYIVDEELEHLFSTLRDMEASERGYLIMGEDDDLRSYNMARQTMAGQLAALKLLTADNAGQIQRLAGVAGLVDAKLAELNEVIEARRSKGFEAAHTMMATGKGRALTAEIQKRLTEVQEEEVQLLHARTTERDADLHKTLLTLLAGGVLSFLLLTTVFLFLMQENHRRRRAEAELRRHRDDLQKTVTARTADLSQANESLRQQREWLHVTLSSIGDAVLATNTAGQITFLNPVAETLTGWEEKGALGQPVQNVFRIINEDTRVPGEDIVARVLHAERAVAVVNHTALVARDGREVPIEDSAAPIKDSAGTISGVVLVFHDVTEKRRAQAALRETQRQNELLAGIIEHSSQAFGIGYPDGRLGMVNRAFEELTGYKAEELRALDWVKTLTPREWQEVERRKLEELHATGQPVRYEKEYLRKDGTRVPIELLVHLARDAEGKPEYYYSFLTDITERKRAEKSQARLAAIVESSDDAILSNDLSGIIASWNVGAERLFGYPPEEAIGRSIRLLLPPDRQDEEDLIMARLQAGERVEHFETVRLTKDGLGLAVSVTSSPLKDGEGHIIGASKIIRDITERKQAEEAVQQLNAELHQRVAELQAANEEVQASRRAALSLAEDALEARKEVEQVNADLLKANDSLDASRRAAFNLMDDAVRARKQVERASAELVQFNRILKAHSKSDQALMRATAEAEFLEAVCRIVVEDCGHTMVWVGFAEEDEAKTVRPVAQAGFEAGYLDTLKVTWADTERGRGPTGTAIRTGQPSRCRNMLTDPGFAPWRTEAIQRGYASSLVLPLLAEGRAFGALTIYSKQPDGFSDDEVRLMTELADDLAYGITALRLRAAKARAEEALRQTAEDLKRSNRDLEQFAYVASHDLQEPLRAVGGYVKLLQLRFPDRLDAKAQGYISGAFDGVTRMERLIRDLLAFSRVATRGDPFVPADLEDALGQALRNLEASVNSSRATIAHDPLPSLSVDAGQIRQLFQNLIGNAIKFHGEQPPNIHIGAQRQDGRWVFRVRDNGIGIEPQYYEKIFHIFQRLHTRKDYPGTGIGLAICKRIIERHGGTIWVESQPGQGSTFYFSLPDTPSKTAPVGPG